LRDINDWKQLCSSCHDAFDGIAKLSKEEADIIRKRYQEGETQKSLGRVYGVSQMSVSNIVNNKTKYYA
jgi:DNA-directed RNA polymerase specialized sigma subunit